MPKDINNVLFVSKYYTIQYAVTKEGRMPAKEDLEKLEKRDQVAKAQQIMNDYLSRTMRE